VVHACYLGLLDLALANARKVILGFLGFLCFRCCWSAIGAGFLPALDGGQIRIHMRAQTGTRIEETTRIADQVSAAIHQILPHGGRGRGQQSGPERQRHQHGL
jgi:multidrug efflux pump subunit AcrB